MENIRTKIEHIGSLLKRAIRLEERIKFIYSASRPGVTGSILDHINKIKRAYGELKNSDESLEPMRMGHYIGACDIGFAAIVNTITSLDLMATTNASNTYILTTITDFNSFEQLWNAHMSHEVNRDVHSYLVAQLVDTDAKEIESAYKSNPCAVALYSAYLQHMFDNTDESKHQLYYDMLETAKTTSLVGSNYEQADPPSKKTMPLQRYGIAAVRQHLTPSGLMCLYLGQGCSSDVYDIDSFIAAAATVSLNVLVIHNVTPYPIEFNVWKLINPSDAHGYVFDTTTGINEKIMDRFKTIAEVGDGGDHELGFMAKPHESKAGADWAIIRTINGVHWDAMSNRKMAVGRNEYRFPIDSLRIPDSTVKRILRGPSPRIDVYQRNKNNTFQGLINIVKNVDNETKYDNKGLIDTLIHRITNRIIAYVDKSLVPLPITQLKLEAAIMDPMFIEIANVEMLKTYAECGVDVTLPVDELVGTFISDVDMTIIVQFSRNLKMNMVEMGPKPKIFKEYKGEALKTRLYNLFVDIIKKSVSSTIRSKENVYEKLLIKNNLLKAIL